MTAINHFDLVGQLPIRDHLVKLMTAQNIPEGYAARSSGANNDGRVNR